MGEIYEGYYGSAQTPCTIFEYANWYVVEGSVNVNHAPPWSGLRDGVNVETIQDDDCFTWSEPIESLEQLIEAVEY
ncbi:hypothetical protein CMI37_27540 [Candidatus Pacearchaeota archaeon]|jgi:hypothetical protein|nr:hypothetical protein [Candidatus Pacearchaeota archaeon]|tara:strand:+ start:126 stop:353 length:228 start_codon:yes stop_codon:yes gene_type:complete